MHFSATNYKKMKKESWKKTRPQSYWPRAKKLIGKTCDIINKKSFWDPIKWSKWRCTGKHQNEVNDGVPVSIKMKPDCRGSYSSIMFRIVLQKHSFRLWRILWPGIAIRLKFAASSIIRVWTYKKLPWDIRYSPDSNTYIEGFYLDKNKFKTNSTEKVPHICRIVFLEIAMLVFWK